MIEYIQLQFVSLAYYFIDANKRLYIGYLLSAFFIAYFLHLRQTQPKPFIKHIFSRHIWFSHTAKQDYSILVINKLIRALVITPVLFSMLPIALIVSDSFTYIFGHLRPFKLTIEYVWFVFTFLLFIIDDLTRFILHLALHKVSFLWAFHQVHHSAETLTPLTVYRSHPVENALYAMRMIIAQGLAVGICYYFFGPKLKMLDILGANLFIFIFNFLGANLRHSHIWWHWGKIEHIFISPAQHQLHHSDKREHIDCNLGTALAIWDKLCGTLIVSTKEQPNDLAFGLKGNNIKHNLISIYFKPFSDFLKRLTRSNN